MAISTAQWMSRQLVRKRLYLMSDQPPLARPPADVQITRTAPLPLIRAKISEKFPNQPDLVAQHMSELNGDLFWTQHCTVQDLARLDQKESIMRVISTFQLISKKSVFLFSNYARKIIANSEEYSAGQLSEVMHAFAQLGFLEESLCMQLAGRIIDDVHSANNLEFVHIADAFASTRCFLSRMNECILNESVLRVPQMNNVYEVSLLLSSLARLAVYNQTVFDLLGHQFLLLTDDNLTSSSCCSARDVTLTAYAFAKMRGSTTDIELQTRIVNLSKTLIRDFTAKELQMLVCAFDKWSLSDAEIYTSISQQATRRMAQFSSESLVHLLRALLNRSALDDQLMTRLASQLPRLALNTHLSELVQLLSVFRDAKFRSQASIEALKAPLLSKAGQMNPTDWMTIIDCLSQIGSADTLSEIADAFILVNNSPAHFRNTTSLLTSTVLQRMSLSQLTSLIKSLRSHHAAKSLVAKAIEARALTPAEASDVYCSLVELNFHTDVAVEKLMRELLAKAVSS